MSVLSVGGQCCPRFTRWTIAAYQTQCTAQLNCRLLRSCYAEAPCKHNVTRLRNLWTASRTTFNKLSNAATDSEEQLSKLFKSTTYSLADTRRQGNEQPIPKNERTGDARRGSRAKKKSRGPGEYTFLKRLDRALLMGNVQLAEAVWQDAEQFYQECSSGSSTASLQGESNAKDAARGPLKSTQDESWTGMTPALYCRFITVFVSLKRQERADAIWDHMVQAGLKPNQALWNAKLAGCRGARNASLLEEVWEQMCATGLKPDSACWTTRIHGLLVGGNLREGMRALFEMGRTWQRAAEDEKVAKADGNDDVKISEMGDIGSVVKPTTATINAALVALLRIRDMDRAQRMLEWAETIGIFPDLTTYNTLLRYMIRTGLSQKALDIYKAMEEAGIKPDIYTFVIVFDGYFKSRMVERQSMADHTPMVNRLFNQIEDAGIPLTVHNYGALVDGLLKNRSNFAAVLSVLQHMASQGIRANSFINTMLVTHYFSVDPPDIKAINHLWKSIQTDPAAYDAIFIDRMIEGWAWIGQINQAMEFMHRAPDVMLGQGIRWTAVTALVRLLLSHGRFGDAEQMVMDVLCRRGLFKSGLRGLNGQDSFWATVDEMKASGLEIPRELLEQQDRTS